MSEKMFGDQGTPEQIKNVEDKILTNEQKEQTEKRIEAINNGRSSEGNYEVPKSKEEFIDLLRKEAFLKMEIREINSVLEKAPKDVLPTESIYEVKDWFFSKPENIVKHFAEIGVELNQEELEDIKRSSDKGYFEGELNVYSTTISSILEDHGWWTYYDRDRKELMMVKIADLPLPSNL
jgi:hypothetical protein